MTTVDKFESDTIVGLINHEGFLRDFSQADDEEERNEIYTHYLSETLQNLKRDKEEVEKNVAELVHTVNKLQEDYELKEIEFTDLVKDKKVANDLIKEAFDEIDKLTKKLSEYENIPSKEKPNQDEVDSLYQKIAELQKQLENVNTDVSASEKVDVAVKNTSEYAINENLVSENRRLQQELNRAKIEYLRYSAAFAIFIVGAIALIFLLANPHSFPWLYNHKHKLGLLLSLTAIWICICLIIANDKFKRWGVGAMVIAFITVIPQIIDN